MQQAVSISSVLSFVHFGAKQRTLPSVDLDEMHMILRLPCHVMNIGCHGNMMGCQVVACLLIMRFRAKQQSAATQDDVMFVMLRLL